MHPDPSTDPTGAVGPADAGAPEQHMADPVLDALIASITPQNADKTVRRLLRNPRYKPERAVPFFVVAGALAGPYNAEDHPDHWTALARVRDTLQRVLQVTPGLTYSPST